MDKKKDVLQELRELIVLMEEHNKQIAVQLAVLNRNHCLLSEAKKAIAELKELYSRNPVTKTNLH